MAVEITWINHASFRIEAGGNVLYIDPWKIPGEPHDADVVFVSHSHHDHCSPPDVAKVSKADTTVIAPAETVEMLGAASSVNPGDQITIKDITIETVAAYNIGKAFHPRGHNWCGAVFSLPGEGGVKRIYYAGDTDIVPEMKNLGSVDLALLPVGGTYTLSAKEAVEACRMIGCRIAIPYHWGDVVGSEADAKAFAEGACCQAKVLQRGEKLSI